MARKSKTARDTPAAWFDQWPQADPAGWDEEGGWCRRHWTPLTQIADPARRDLAGRCASLELMVAFAADLRRQVAPLPVPAHHLSELVRILSPVCCRLGDDTMQAIVLAARAWTSAGTTCR